VFLLDVDNTLLDNDAVSDDLRRHLLDTFGADCQERYWRIFEELRLELGYADYLGALQRYRMEHPRDPKVVGVSLFLLEYPFADRLYPRALEAVAQLRRRAPVVILSDGDAVFQPHKVERSGLWAAVEGEVLIYIHKEQVLDDVEHRYPARRYVMVDDKIRILTAMKSTWRDRLTTVFVRQGHYAIDRAVVDGYPAADVTLDRIGDLVDRADLLLNFRAPAASDAMPAPES
jgi:FMN phosphatase YigB (HAD superfamily)